jgi:hypothetical protein
MGMMTKLVNLTGRIFGDLTVIERAGRLGNSAAWRIQCKCGTVKIVRSNNLLSGSTLGCGKHKKGSRLRHGMKGTPEYEAWCNMKARCYNPNYDFYVDYGGRGIKVCERWLHSFENFFADMGKRPNADYSIDREDVDGDYEPGNCRWADRPTQSQNRRMRRDNKTGVKCLFWRDRPKPWIVCVRRNRKIVLRTSFYTREEAVNCLTEEGYL